MTNLRKTTCEIILKSLEDGAYTVNKLVEITGYKKSIVCKTINKLGYDWKFIKCGRQFQKLINIVNSDVTNGQKN